MLRTLQREAEAEDYFARAIALFPEHRTLLVHRASRLLFEASDEEGRVESDEPRWQEAEALIQRALAQGPRNQEAYLVRGRWQQARGEYMAAMLDYENAIAAAPDVSLGYLALADLNLALDIYSDERNGAEGAVRRGLARGLRDPALRGGVR